MPSRLRKKHYLSALVAGGLLAGGLSACTGGGGDATVQVGRVERGDVAEVVEAPATVSARATAVRRAPAKGTVKRLYVADGDRVREGDVLATISSPEARERLAQAREADRSVSAGSGTMPTRLDLSGYQHRTDRSAREGFAAARKIALRIADPRQRALVLAGITRAEAEYRTAAAAARTAVARLNAGLGSVGATMSSITAAQRVQTRAAVRAAERTVQELTIRAPFDGVVGLGGPAGGAQGGLGDLLDQLPQGVQAQGGPAGLGDLGGGGAAKDASAIATGAPVVGGDAIVTVTDVSRLSLFADVDETDVLQVRKGVQADVEFDAVQGGSYKAEVTGIGVTPKQSNGGGVTYKVTLALGEGTLSGGGTAPRPKPGMSAVVFLRVRDARAVLAVPSSAIVSSGRESVVWVVSGGRAQRRVVGLGAQGDATVQVTRGLQEGERIVVRGADSVERGQELDP
ncbi:efflux RND transporter periplasmic adaptor subunit [Actinomadura spongiicola]|uniref:efflux RND transporter periplasmic adaptor subunit n=1 Tax=Actinomadura spongiicola TaxID=2303421 RepID=UPI001313E904|nr:HlyD family efflux transporter periplasmic adaptor subunit [Actinomadura spongiicola]